MAVNVNGTVNVNVEVVDQITSKIDAIVEEIDIFEGEIVSSGDEEISAPKKIDTEPARKELARKVGIVGSLGDQLCHEDGTFSTERAKRHLDFLKSQLDPQIVAAHIDGGKKK